jgi:hypothetical protein
MYPARVVLRSIVPRSTARIDDEIAGRVKREKLAAPPRWGSEKLDRRP